MDITKKLLYLVKNLDSHIRYKVDLEEKKRLELARKEKQRKDLIKKIKQFRMIME